MTVGRGLTRVRQVLLLSAPQLSSTLLPVMQLLLGTEPRPSPFLSIFHQKLHFERVLKLIYHHSLGAQTEHQAVN